ncbi:hypothetical protein PFICI_01241 [Pestalotiopsis fici W106-1]|uniref:DUF7587 domain-containing protein n=1 Tax=Pestalotiopsis fici (strain W106-1 / CGMCC3.15140) TaxID=1229662 RepID=W3XMY8_PESFW|nr:uncharacterized protein PFICI_01241 [Pestalotiopsis fici W106-1]ETS87413.1 hypothetical protein PFICI_01241 [Pestalotiopsis fici W106-1]
MCQSWSYCNPKKSRKAPSLYEFQAGLDTVSETVPLAKSHKNYGTKSGKSLKKAEHNKKSHNESTKSLQPSTKKIKTHDPKGPEPLLLNPTLKDAKAYLDARRSTLPRFFFRGFHAGSGGGIPGLNNKKGITPHGFLRGQTPTTMYAIKNVHHMIHYHLSGVVGNSHFSSWSADLHTALGYSGAHGGKRYGRHIAVLDTRLLEPHVEVYHTEDLRDAGLSNQAYSYEWLIYGPITGVAYRCASVDAMENIGLPIIYTITARPAKLMTTEAAVVTAKKVGELFRHDQDKSPDVILAVAAAVLGLHFRRLGQRGLEPGVIDSAARLWAHELRTLKKPKLPTIGTGILANPLTPTRNLPGLELMVDLLIALEQRAIQAGAQSTPVVIDLTNEVDDDEYINFLMHGAVGNEAKSDSGYIDLTKEEDDGVHKVTKKFHGLRGG